MIRARFKITVDDPRPVLWPIPHPYWVTGYAGDATIIVAYGDTEEQLRSQWPEITEFDFVDERDSYTFTDRFPKPQWLSETTASEGGEA